MKRTIVLAFVLLLVFMVLIYYVGLKTDLPAVTTLLQGVGNTYSGRNAQGQATSFPGGYTAPHILQKNAQGFYA
jgi:hypothetical protein